MKKPLLTLIVVAVMVAIGFKMMYSAHRIEINNLKIILEERYGA